MRILIGIYLTLFLGIGVWSVVTNDERTPPLERVVDAAVFLVLSLGMLLFLIGRPAPGGPAVWLVATGGICALELLVIARDRRRTIRIELAEDDPEELRRLARITDLTVVVYFLPAIVFNVWYALR